MDSMRELDSMKCRWRAASSCSLPDNLSVADSMPSRQSVNTLGQTGERLVRLREAVIQCLLRDPGAQPGERLDLLAQGYEHPT